MSFFLPPILFGSAVLLLVSALVGLPEERDALHRHLHAGLEVAELLILVVHRELTRVTICKKGRKFGTLLKPRSCP